MADSRAAGRRGAARGCCCGGCIPGGPAVPAIAGSAASLVVAIAGAGRGRRSRPGARCTRPRSFWTPTGGIPLADRHPHRRAGRGRRRDGRCRGACSCRSTHRLHGAVTRATPPTPPRSRCSPRRCCSSSSPSDLFVLLVGWEVMGLCSYFLIGHYWQTEGARAAAVKAFVTTRIGDTGFLFGIFVLGVGTHSFEIGRVVADPRAPRAHHGHRGRLAAARRRGRQERAVPAARLAARTRWPARRRSAR